MQDLFSLFLEEGSGEREGERGSGERAGVRQGEREECEREKKG